MLNRRCKRRDQRERFVVFEGGRFGLVLWLDRFDRLVLLRRNFRLDLDGFDFDESRRLVDAFIVGIASSAPLGKAGGDLVACRSNGVDWNARAGAVTRTEFGRAQFGSRSPGSGRGGGAPSLERFLSEDAERAAGGEMALDVDGVENGGVNGQEALG